MLEEIAIKNQNLFHVRDTKGKTPLYFAASKGYLEGFKFLLKYSEKSTLERSIKGNFPIHAACKNGHVDIVNELLEQQWPNPTEFLNNEGQNILHIAAKSGKYVVVKNLLRNPKLEMFEINAKDNLGNTALHLASMNLHPNVVCSLTWEDKRVDLELRNNDGLTAVDVLVDRVSMPPSTLREV
jgi:serine/threonine-protein phosphatase 6 regulatory ankyrin repeat subunit B